VLLCLAGAALTAPSASAAIEPLPGCLTQTLPANDDGSTASAVDLGFSFTFFGTPYSAAYVNNNGNVTFSAPLSAFVPESIATIAFPMIAPFWGDVDTRGPGSDAVTYGATSFLGRPAFCVNWGGQAGVGYFNSHTDRLNKVQLLIVNRDDLGAGNADLYLNYDQVQWDQGDASNSVSARWGYSNGLGNAFEGPGSAVTGALLDGGPDSLAATSTNSAVPGRHVFLLRTVEPETALILAPPALTNDPTPSFTFSADQEGALFECRFDDAPFAACDSPFTAPAPLPDGDHSFEVRASVASGAADSTPARADFAVDTVAPETSIDSADQVSSSAASFRFSANEGGAAFQCALDDAPLFPCSSPFVQPGLSPGAHTFRVQATDGAGNVDASPASASITITAPVRPADRDGDAVPDATDNCADTPNADQNDADADLIGDACDASNGALAPEVAKTVQARVESGTVRILKGGTFVALDGAHTIPVGVTIDATGGAVTLTSSTGRRGATQSATFRAGIFRIRQRRARARNAAVPTDAVLAGRSFASSCRRSKPQRGKNAPPRGVVRGLTATAKGIWRTVARASTATVTDATFTTQDRCNGTLTKVVRGRASVRDVKRKKTVTVRAGRSYLVRLFAAKLRRGR
jgi:hypothetical protein